MRASAHRTSRRCVRCCAASGTTSVRVLAIPVRPRTLDAYSSRLRRCRGYRGEGIVALSRLEDTQLTRADPAEDADAVPDPVLVRDERHSTPRRAVLQADRASRLHVLPQGAHVEPVEVLREVHEDVEPLAPRE